NVPRAEIRPVGGRKIKLGVGELPDKEIGNALLTAGANEQIGLGRVGHGQKADQRSLVDALGMRRVFRMLGQKALRGLEDVPSAAVICGNGEMKRAVLCGTFLCATDEFL